MTTAQQHDVVDLLLDQHRQVKELFANVASAQGTYKRELFEDLVRLLAVHETVEEEIVHPIARRRIEGGDEIVERRLREEEEAKRALAELDDLGVEHPGFDATLDRLAQMVAEHTTREEYDEFPYLRQELSPDQRERMASALRAAEKLAPTRPHPGTGTSAVANLLAGPPLAVFDRVRDAVRDWRQSHADKEAEKSDKEADKEGQRGTRRTEAKED